MMRRESNHTCKYRNGKYIDRGDGVGQLVCLFFSKEVLYHLLLSEKRERKNVEKRKCST